MNQVKSEINHNDKWIFPSFEMPSIWYNEDEIYNLMHTFKRPRNIDPTAYDFKINFWSNLLLRYALHHHLLMINENQMKSIFTIEFKSNGLTCKPECSSTILQSMEIDGKLKEISAFEGGSLIGKLITGVGWIIKAPISWSYNRISSIFLFDNESDTGDSNRPLGDLVVLDSVNHCLAEFMQWLVDHTDIRVSPHLDIVTLTDFQNLFSSYFPHVASRNLAQQLLINRRQIEIVTLSKPRLIQLDNNSASPPNAMQVVKFARATAGNGALTDTGLRKELMDQISGLVQLRALTKRLEADERAIEEKIEKIRTGVKMYLRAGKKEEAKNHLKRSKVTEKMLERKRIQLQNVENMLLEIESSSDNMQVVAALSNAAGALKARSMDIDSVHDAMAEVGDTLAEQEEINASMISAIGDFGNDDLLELEEELANLLVDKAPVSRLPNVPAFSPSAELKATTAPRNPADGGTRLAQPHRY